MSWCNRLSNITFVLDFWKQPIILHNPLKGECKSFITFIGWMKIHLTIF